jgi:KUP system potassium uptake protein
VGVPPPLLHNLAYNKIMHEQVILLTVRTTDSPHVAPAQRAHVERLADRFFRVTLDYGFMDHPDVPMALGSLPAEPGLRVNMVETAFFLGRETLLATGRPGMYVWREKLFAFMARNAQRATAFFKIPPERVIEIGMQVEL